MDNKQRNICKNAIYAHASNPEYEDGKIRFITFNPYEGTITTSDGFRLYESCLAELWASQPIGCYCGIFQDGIVFDWYNFVNCEDND